MQQGVTHHAQTAQQRACDGTDAATDHEEDVERVGEDSLRCHADVLTGSLSVGQDTTGNDAHGTIDHCKQAGDGDNAQRDGTLRVLGDSGHRDGSHRGALAGPAHHSQCGDETGKAAVEEAAISAGEGAGKINLADAEGNEEGKSGHQNQSDDIFQNGEEAGTLDGGKEEQGHCNKCNNGLIIL